METVGRLTVRLIQEAWTPDKARTNLHSYSLWVWKDGELQTKEAHTEYDTHDTLWPDININQYWRGWYDPRRGKIEVGPPWTNLGDSDDVVQALMNQYNVGPDKIISMEPDRWKP